MEVTFGLVKPTSYEDRFRIANMIFETNLEILMSKDPYRFTQKKAEEFYKEHEGKKFYDNLIEMITAGPVALYLIGGINAIEKIKRLSGPTDPREAEPWTIRSRFGKNVLHNAFHRSDSEESAKREIELAFIEDELKKGLSIEYLTILDSYIRKEV